MEMNLIETGILSAQLLHGACGDLKSAGVAGCELHWSLPFPYRGNSTLLRWVNPKAVLALADTLFISAKDSLYFHYQTTQAVNRVQLHLKNA